jgi:hypothetical protein
MLVGRKCRKSATQQAAEKHTAVLGFTLVDARSITRWPCPHRPSIEVVVWPHFSKLSAKVRDLSEYGIGLSCPSAIERGASVLFRLEPFDRLISAKVIHSTQVRGGWYIGCALAEQLTPYEVVAYVTSSTEPGA